MNINKLACILSNCYDQDTCYPKLNDNWNVNNKFLGQCAVTALIVNKYLGGIIKKCYVGDISHYFNVINDEIIDLTKQQFENQNIDYSNFVIKNRNDILRDKNTKMRYEILLRRVNKSLIKYNDIEKEVNNCNLCDSLTEKFTNETSIYYGKNSDIIILGEAPANNGWRKSGKVWHDINNRMLPSGKILNQLFDKINIDLMDITFLEAVKCFPLNRKNLNVCNKNCSEILLKQLELLNPKIIITLGNFPTKSLLNTKYTKFSDIVGKVYEINILSRRIKVLPIYHPSPISPMSYKGNLPIFEKLKFELLR